MSYGSVRQYRNRVTRLLGAGERGAISVCCPGCVDTESACVECSPIMRAWGDQVLLMADLAGATTDCRQLKDLVR